MKNCIMKRYIKKRDVMKKNIIIILIIFLFCLIIGLFLLLSIRNVFETQELKMDVIVADHVGINLDTDAIHFGTVKKENPTSRTREVSITNNYDQSREVFLSVNGELSEWALLSENQFVLLPKENKTVKITLKVSPWMRYGTFNGTLKAVFKEAK